MTRTRKSAGPIAIAIASALALFAAAPATAQRTYRVAGRQVVLDQDAGTNKMFGGLRGIWVTTSFNELATTPLYRAEGTESFTGCLDRKRDRSCAGDPSGTLRFRFLYWGKFGPGDQLVWGSCWHPVVGGTGAFSGADGVLTFVDSPTGSGGVSTRYVGSITLAGRAAKARHRARAAASRRGGCGSVR